MSAGITFSTVDNADTIRLTELFADGSYLECDPDSGTSIAICDIALRLYNTGELPVDLQGKYAHMLGCQHHRATIRRTGQPPRDRDGWGFFE